MEIIHLGLIEKAKYIGSILPAIQECKAKLGIYELPIEAFSEAELELATDIQKLIDTIATMERRVFDFYNRAELSDIDFDSILYEEIRSHNRWEKRNPQSLVTKAHWKLVSLKSEKERIDKQISLWEQKQSEFTMSELENQLKSEDNQNQ